MTLSGLIALLLFILVPCAMAAWFGTRLRRPLVAFVLAWLLTPILTLVVEILLWPVLRALIPPNNDGTGAIMLPFFGILTGVIAGGVSAISVARRTNRATVTHTVGTRSSEPMTNAERSGQPEPPMTPDLKS